MPRPLRIVAAATAVAALVGAGCSGGGDGTPRATTAEREVDAFTRVVIEGQLSATITVGGEQSVQIITDTDLADQVTSTVDSGTLTITTPAEFSPLTPSSIEIAVPELEGVAVISGSANTTVSAQEISADSFTAEVVGEATLQLGGEVEELFVSVNQAGVVEAFSLAAQDVEVTSLSTSDSLVSALRTLTVTLGSSGNVIYNGQPEVTQTATGTGQVLPNG